MTCDPVLKPEYWWQAGGHDGKLVDWLADITAVPAHIQAEHPPS
jgi:hypothetical protein